MLVYKSSQIVNFLLDFAFIVCYNAHTTKAKENDDEIKRVPCKERDDHH